MRLLSALTVMVGVLATVSFVGTYATFSDSGTASGGPVEAGTVDIKLDAGFGQSDDLETFVWDLAPNCNPVNLASGVTCSVAGVKAVNAGSLTFTYDFDLHVDPIAYLSCFAVSESSVIDLNGGTTKRMPPGDEELFGMNLVLNDAAECQGIAANVGLTLVATQAADPYSTVD